MRFVSFFMALSLPMMVMAKSAYDFSFDAIEGGKLNLSEYRGKVVLVVNTASRCGFTPQYEGLQSLYEEMAPEGLMVVGVPSDDFSQEPLNNEGVKEFCEVTFGIDFPMTTKSHVKESDKTHPFYRWTAEELGRGGTPIWNFHKILIGRDGQAIKGYAPSFSPESRPLRQDIKDALAEKS
jgi:Glutathione peroxidase